MKFKANRALVAIVLSVAMIVVAVNAWFAFRTVNSLVESERWVDHTWQVIVQVERIMSSAKDLETGARGFIITCDEAYLDPYYTARHELPVEIDQFRNLTVDNPSQQTRIVEMQALIAQRIAGLENRIAFRRQLGKDKQYVPNLNGTGKKTMDRMRQLAADMESEERRLLAIRTAHVLSDRTRALDTVIFASGLDFLLILLAFRFLTRERRMRIAAELSTESLALARAETERRSQEVRLLNATLEERVKLRTAELETVNQELESFSYSVSHDLRAPLRTVDGFSVALEEDYRLVVDDIGRGYILRIRAGVLRMGMVIDSLLQLSRVTRAELIREPFDLSLLAESVASVLAEEHPDREIVIHIEPGLQAVGDARLLRVALENLFGNAVKFSARASHPVIDFGWDEQQQAWFVRDNGAGFDMAYVGKLFGAFNRLHGDREFQGTGIGLATVARVVRRHQGQIWAEGAVDLGATFWFRLG